MRFTVAQTEACSTLMRAIEHLSNDMNHPATLHAISRLLIAVELVKVGDNMMQRLMEQR